MEKHAKKKAKEILKKYTDLKVTILGCVDRGNACVVTNNLLDQSAKQCALIDCNGKIELAERVSDISSNYFRLTKTGNYGDAYLELEFWQEVKTEINKL